MDLNYSWSDVSGDEASPHEGSRWDDVSHDGEYVLYSRMCRDLSSSSRLVGATSGGRKSTNLWSPVRRRAPKVLINNQLHSVPEKHAYVQPIRCRNDSCQLLSELADCRSEAELDAVLIPSGMHGHSWPRVGLQSFVQLLPSS